MSNEGYSAYNFCRKVFPLARSLTGEGTRSTLKEIANIIPELKLHKTQTGVEVFDWSVPDEWNIRSAYIECLLSGERVVDFADNNLHVVGYSVPVDRVMSFSDLDKHLYSLPDQPNAIPYIVSYYRKRWGFCLSHQLRQKLASVPERQYRVVIDSDLGSGFLDYGDVLIEGDSKDEILLSTYICHPSMANNELSGPSTAIELIKWLQSLPKLRYSYRFLFLPETIGSLVYLSRHLQHLKTHVKAGFVLSCLGDDGDYSIVQSRYANTYADQIAGFAIKQFTESPSVYSFLERGSDERQFCSPGIDLPVCTLSRTKFGEYPEYHTSLDDLSFISPEGLQGGFDFVRLCLQLLEKDDYYITTVLGEPQLGPRGLYPTLSTKDTKGIVRNMMDLIAYADGSNNLVDIGDITGMKPKDLLTELGKLCLAGVLKASS
ncbi:DUF4910 domain-containing protein [Oceanospirillum sp. HFRX-1_2]